MVKITVLDDYHSRFQIKKVISSNLDYNSSIHLEDFKENNYYDIYFINPDIILNDESGMDIAERIRQNYPQSEIIIIGQDHLYLSFANSIKVSGYLIKPLRNIKIKTALKAAIEKVTQKTTILQLNQKKKKIPINDLLYVNIERRCPCYHLKENQLLFGSTIRGKFEEATRYLMNKPELLRAGPSLIVNIDNIEELSKEKIIFSNKEELYLPRGSYERIYPVWEYYFNREEEIF